MIRVLHSVSNMDRAGVETMLMNYYRHIDRTQLQFDFLCHKSKPGDYDAEIKAMGGRIFVTPGYRHPLRYFKWCKQFYREHPEYRILHAHNGSLMAFALAGAKLSGIPVRIAHAHATRIPPDRARAIKYLVKPLIPLLANAYWGCSEMANQFYFGNHRRQLSRTLICNAIDLQRFAFNNENRQRLRAEYHWENAFIIGHIGRMMPQKNHSRLLDIFAEVHRQKPESRLVLIGCGELENDLRKKVSDLALDNMVSFIGVRSDVEAWYSVFDAFVLPSLYEGLPVVGIEAQASGLPCFFSDTITPETAVTKQAHFLSLDSSDRQWAEAILQHTHRQPDTIQEITQAHYDIRVEAQRLMLLYSSLQGDMR